MAAFHIVSVSVPQDAADTGWELPVRLDNRFQATGIYDAGTGKTTWTFPDSMTWLIVDTGVKGPDFGADEGEEFDVESASSTTVTATGDYSAGECYIGRKYTMNVTLSQPYMRDRDGSAILDAVLLLVKLVTNHQNTGPYTIRVVQPLSRSRDVAFAPPSGLTQDEGVKQVHLLGNAKDTTVSIRATGPTPVAIATAEYEVTYNKLSR